MATITIGLTSGVVTGTKTYTLSDADVTRWINAAKEYLKDDLRAISNPTNAQVLAAWADYVIRHTKDFVKSVEARQAAPAGISIT